MSGIEAAGLALGMISAIISIIDATNQVYEAVKDEAGLPTNFKKSATKLPLISKLLEDAERYVKAADEATETAFTPTLEDCKAQAIQLQELFEKVMPEEGESRWDRYVKAARTIGKGGRVENLVGGILDDLQLLATRFPEVTTPRTKEQLAKAVEEVTKMEPSLPDGFEQMPAYAHYGSGDQNINTGSGIQHINSGKGHQNSGSGTMIIGDNYNVHKNVTVDDVDRSCLRTLRCPNTLAVKNRLKESKDKLLHKSIDWILQDPKYLSWRDSDNGGAGKGKTMMSIGLIERLSLLQDKSTVVTYFFCQNADHELNTLGAILKGLILQLDTTNERFDEDITSWRTLWNIFLEMLHRCKCPRVYVVVDALDECQDDGMADLLKFIVRTGLDQPSKIKWLLTSRPLDSAEQELLAGSDQVGVSLELNQKHLSEVVKTYIAFKVCELDRRWKYGETLRREVETELAAKAEDTFLWVSLVCRTLESVHRDNTLTTIQDLPPGLHPFYNRVFRQLSSGDSAAVKGCMRLLKAILLAYRPLNVAEVRSVSGLSDEWVSIRGLVDRCASFLKMRGTDIEFVHQSARDYLTGEDGQSILDSYEYYGHGGIALNCLSYLSRRLKVNLVDLPQPDSTRELMKGNGLSASVAYAATFWVQHLHRAQKTTTIQKVLSEHGEVGTFLRTKLLEWLECLSLLDKLPHAVEAFKIITDIADDAIRFLSRHYQTLATWPLQAYSSAIIFSPQTSIVRSNNLEKVPTWLRKFPQVEDTWASLIQTLAGHSDPVSAVAFSPDGQRIASGSSDMTIKLWDATTGDLIKTLAGHSDWVRAVAFSPDGQRIASGSDDKTIKLWDATTGDLMKTLAGHSDWVSAVAFSPDGQRIASGSDDKTIKLWDVTKSLKISKILGSSLGRHFKFRVWQEIKTSEPVASLGFTTNGRCLVTNL
ncbi:hypothetical protein IFR05_016284, partial [Cadophora sp. M221]